MLCFEEPENGVHPFRLQKLVDLLRGLTTDFSDPYQAEEPLRQLIVNTHSPVLAQKLDVERELLFAHLATRIEGNKRFKVTRIVPVKADPQLRLRLGLEEEELAYTMGEVMAYLESGRDERFSDRIPEVLVK